MSTFKVEYHFKKNAVLPHKVHPPTEILKISGTWSEWSRFFEWELCGPSAWKFPNVLACVFLNKQAGLPLENEWLEHNKKWMEDDVLPKWVIFRFHVNFQGCTRSEFENKYWIKKRIVLHHLLGGFFRILEKMQRFESSVDGAVLIPTSILLMAEMLHQLIGTLSHCLQGFLHPRRCRISSFNSIIHWWFHLLFLFWEHFCKKLPGEFCWSTAHERNTTYKGSGYTKYESKTDTNLDWASYI